MANMHLVTGYAGTEHIQSADEGALNAAMFGSLQAVLGKGNRLSASAISNNTVRVLDGDIIMQGRHIRLNENTYVDLVIDSGEQGKKRNDLIVARYTKNSSTMVEEVNLVVIKGNAVASNPSDPSYTNGNILDNGATLNDMPLYRVPLDGINIGEPVALFRLLTDSVGDIAVMKTDIASKVPNTRKVNGKALSSNITLSASDVNAVPTTRKVNGKALSGDVTLTASDVGARESSWMPTAAQVGAVPTTRKVNGFALSSDIALTAANVGAIADADLFHGTPDGDFNDKTIPGWYWMRLENCTNRPDETGYGFLEVVSSVKGGTESILHRFTNYGNRSVKERSRVNGEWNTWGRTDGRSCVPNTFVINGHTMTANFDLTASDVNAVPTTRKVNDKALSADITLGASDVGAVPTTRKVNDRELSADVTLFYGTGSGDFNERTIPGIYWMKIADCTNAPPTSGYGYLEVLSSSNRADGSNSVLQRYTNYSTKAVYVRSNAGSGNWNAWVRIDAVNITYGTADPSGGANGDIYFKIV